MTMQNPEFQQQMKEMMESPEFKRQIEEVRCPTVAARIWTFVVVRKNRSYSHPRNFWERRLLGMFTLGGAKCARLTLARGAANNAAGAPLHSVQPT